MKRLFGILVVLLSVTIPAGAQVATGRSNVGPLLPVMPQRDAEAAGKSVWIKVTTDLGIPSGSEYISPKERARLRVFLTNEGKQSARGVLVRVTPDGPVNGVSINEQILIGDIIPGAARTAIFYVVAAENVPSQTAKFKIEIRDAEGALIAEPRSVAVVTRGKPKTR